MDELEGLLDPMDDDALEALLDGVGEAIEADEALTSMINMGRISALAAVFKLMKENAAGRGVKVSYQLHEPFQSMGSVSVSGKQIKFRSPGCLAVAANKADNFELYPKTDGSVQMTFTFHSLTTPIE